MVTPTHHSTPAQALLVTRLAAPPVQPRLVSRPRLLQKLQEGLAGWLTLVSAAAGFGKTTRVSAWVRGMTQAMDELPSDSPQITLGSPARGDDIPLYHYYTVTRAGGYFVRRRIYSTEKEKL